MAEYPSQFKVLPRAAPAREGRSRGQSVMRRLGGARMEKCLFGKEEILIPEALVEDMSVFLEIMSSSTWQNIMTDTQRRHLLTFLPTFSENDVLEKQETLRQLFGGQNFKFGNPLKKFHKKLRDGLFSPDIAKYAALCRKAKLREYRYQQQVYYATLLKEILVNRQRILEQMYVHRPESPINYSHFQWRPPTSASNDRSLQLSVKSKVKQFLVEVSEECGVEHISSDEEELDKLLSQQGSSKLLLPTGVVETDAPDSPPPSSSVLCTLDPSRSQLNGQPATDTPVKRPRKPREITEHDYHLMLSRHKKRHLEYPDHPELDTKKVVFEDILAKCHIKAKSLKAHVLGPPKKKPKIKTEEIKRETPIIKSEPLSSLPTSRPESVMTGGDEADGGLDVSVMRDEGGVYHNFFSLLRDLIQQEADTKVTTTMVVDWVQQWQDTPQAAHNAWFTTNTWSDLVPSALKFLADSDLLSCVDEGQLWFWTTGGQDADAQLAVLYQTWLDKLSSMPESDNDRSGSPPPPRSRTSFVVRPSTEEEKMQYRRQERERYSNPHRAFTVLLHSYEAVLGPVKGVYGKESSAMTKAREHNLLISDRPPFVTILTLVRDAAARLPNGEGTRGDICELLKDSQFLAPNVTDTQINTVVSGALDRLHYEKDPCVKYDVNRKLWIYLHRNRTEDEFEKIHEAQGAAAKAKKALGKPKPSKKSKESGGAVPGTAVTPPAVSRQSSALSTGSNDSFINVETLSPTSSPRPAPTSPRGTSPRLLLSSPSPQSLSKPSQGVSSAAKVSQILQTASLEAARPATQPPASARLLAGQQPLGTVGKISLPSGVMAAETISIPGPASSILASKLASPISSSSATLGAPTLTNPLRVMGSPRTSAKPANIPRLMQHVGGAMQHVGGAMHQLGGAVTMQQLSSTGQPIIGGLPQQGATQQLVTSVGQGQQVAAVRTASAQLLRTAGSVGTVAAALQRTRATDSLTMTAPPNITQQQVGLGKGSSIDKSASPQIQSPRASPQANFTTKPIIIGGKPLQIGGKPVQIVGKAGSTAQFGVVQGLQGQIQGIQGQVQSLQGLQGQVVTTIGSQTCGGSTPSTPTTPISSSAAAYVSAQLAQVLQNAGQGQLKVTCALGNVTTAKLLNQKAGVGQARSMTMSQANLLAGQQILVQQGGQGTAKVVTPQQFLSTANLRPAMLSGGKPGTSQNIQLVKTVLAQPGGKPGQTTILLSQPGTGATQNFTTLGGSTIQGTPVNKIVTSTTTGATAKTKAGPVYARIITPPPGMRLAAVRGSSTSVSSPGLTTMPPGVIQALSRLPGLDSAQLTSAATSDTPSSSDNEQK